MDIVLLKTLLAVAETGSFSGAANSLHCVQSNVTSRIRRLEDHFGQKIFLRGKAGAKLTDFGERLHAKAEDLLQLFAAAERELLDASGAGAPLSLGSMETTAAVRLPALLKRLKGRSPASSVSLKTGPTADLLAMVRDRKIDAAFVAGPVDSTRFNAVRAFTERLVCARNPANPDNGSLLAFRTGCSYRATAQAWLKSLGRSDTEITEMGTLDGILGCVAAGLGFAVAPEEAVRGARDADQIEIAPLPEPFATVDTFLVWRIDHVPVEAHRTLIEVLEGHS
ncbi:LysR family transcriptional regulator [Roseibium aggregatum]|uniref:LysR family transcriptional regulator n=1 Tax=Roseibium aggregatum TaxID=187304 RepID=A0A926NYT7_9HYPH|nr:LysR family transcriptional regulator [Roseibium aggregatum]MBD1546600.1 LysR family transcriptional regulator [Roseibium aggregatum]